MICVQSNLTSAPKFAYTISEQNLAEMSLTPPADNSRSSSPGGEPKARAVSGSLKDRIARFNNPSATPLVPAHPFGTSGPAPPGSNARGGLVGNRIPSLDPRSAGMLGGQRKVSEGKGLIGNRIPSVTGVEKAPSGRSASPAGSVGSSVASGRAASSNSPVTSRASSPPTSPGPGLPPSLLAATLPDLDMGGPGAMTPSSTRAEAGEPTSELSRPTTPVQSPASGAHYDLNQPNLDNLAETSKAKSSSLQVGGDVPPPGGSLSALGSSRASQYDPSADGSENPKKMMEDVSGVSTPMGTPKAERVDIEMRSTQGSVVGDNDMEDLQARLKGLDVPDRDATPEPVAEVLTPQKTPEAQAQQPLEEMSTPKSVKNEVVEPIDIGGAQGDHDPNTDPDLDDLKAGELSTDTEALAEEKEPGTVVDSMAEAGLVQGLGEEVIPESEQKQQGGVAGQQVEDIEHPTQVEQPKPDESTEYADNQELDVRTVTSDASPAQDSAAQPQQEQSEGSTTQQGPKDDGFDVETQPAQLNDQDTMPDIIEGARASGVRLSDAEKAGTGPTTSGEVDHLKDHLQQERLERGERREETEKAGELQTEEDRDEGAPRREQLVKALDQNKNPDADEEGEVSQETKDAARAATEQIVGPVEKQVDEDAPADGAKDTADEVDNSTKAIGDVPSEDKADNSGKPLQIHIEPAPIAQPADDDITPPASASAPDDAGLQTQAEPEVEVSAAAFPTPPSGEPSGFDESAKSDSSTPIDPTVVKSFPDVPDEAKPRVEVHVPSSPVQSPAKLATASAQPIIAAPDTPTKGATESTLTTPNTRSSLDSDKGSKLSKRASMSYSPKSPYLDDEVPQDFQGGWATVTKGRET